jgi:homoserine O-succinyltransferase
VSRPEPSRSFAGARPRLTIGLVNNMPDAALQTTERQFGDLLAEARPDFDIELRLFSFSNVQRGQRALAHMRGRYQNADALPRAGLDGLIVTGAEPRATDLADEPYWDEFSRLADWAEATSVPTVWSCLAAHAAVLHQAGVRRHRLGAKKSGVFAGEIVSDDALLADAPAQIFTPHSRLNELREAELTSAGYRIITRSPAAGVDCFVRRGDALHIYFQGHPEYDADTLAREYLRDVGRFLRGEQSTHPATPAHYFDEETERALRALAARAERYRRPDFAGAYARAVERASILPLWRGFALHMLGGWLGEANRRPARASNLKSA